MKLRRGHNEARMLPGLCEEQQFVTVMSGGAGPIAHLKEESVLPVWIVAEEIRPLWSQTGDGKTFYCSVHTTKCYRRAVFVNAAIAQKRGKCVKGLLDQLYPIVVLALNEAD